METRYVERHIQSLSLAKTCAEFGARVRTISFITGLQRSELMRLLFIEGPSQCGRAPDSPEWYHQANLLEKAEAAMVVAIYRGLRELGFGPAEALVGGFRHYREHCPQSPRISFDRAFDLVCQIEGIWVVDSPQLAVVTCTSCLSRFICAIGETPGAACPCPFCKLLKRYHFDKRVRTTFPPRALPTINPEQFGLLSALMTPG